MSIVRPTVTVTKRTVSGQRRPVAGRGRWNSRRAPRSTHRKISFRAGCLRGSDRVRPFRSRPQPGRTHREGGELGEAPAATVVQVAAREGSARLSGMSRKPTKKNADARRVIVRAPATWGALWVQAEGAHLGRFRGDTTAGSRRGRPEEALEPGPPQLNPGDAVKSPRWRTGTREDRRPVNISPARKTPQGRAERRPAINLRWEPAVIVTSRRAQRFSFCGPDDRSGGGSAAPGAGRPGRPTGQYRSRNTLRSWPASLKPVT